MKATEHDEYYILFSYSVFFFLTWLYCDIESVCKLLSYNPRLNLHTSSRSGAARTNRKPHAGSRTHRSATRTQICINIHRDAVPPSHAVSYHVATDKVPAQNGDKFRSIFSDSLQPIATRGKKARSMLLVDQHCGNGCSIKRAPLSVSYYNEISGGHIGSFVVRTRYSAGLVLLLWLTFGNRNKNLYLPIV